MKQYCPHRTTSIYPCKVCSETVQSNIQITQLENQLQACRVLIKEQDKEIEVLNQSYEILFKHRINQEKENQLLKKEIKDLRQIVEGTIKQAFYEDDYYKLKAEYDLLKADLEVKKACFGELK